MLAIMLANYAEHTSVTSTLYSSIFIHNKVQIVDGVRATDDGLVFVVVNKLRLQTFNNALLILKKFKKEFVKNMGGKTVLEFDQVFLSYTYLKNIIINDCCRNTSNN